MLRKLLILSVVFFGVTSTAQAHTVIHKHQAKKLSLAKRIELQNRIIKHDRWVISTHRVHTKRAVKWHRKQLQWVTRELRQSKAQLRRTISSLRSRVLYSSSVCWSCWDRVAQCESGGNWSISTGNGFYGGLQWVISTWLGAGGGRYASNPIYASREQQISIASTLSLSNWPVCQRFYGG